MNRLGPVRKKGENVMARSESQVGIDICLGTSQAVTVPRKFPGAQEVTKTKLTCRAPGERPRLSQRLTTHKSHACL